MKKIIILLLIVILAISFSFGQDKKQIVMKFGHYAVETHPAHKAALMFAEGVEKRTHGAIKIVIYPNNALGSPPELLEQNILGAIEMSLPTQGALAKYSKKFNCVMLPFVFKDYSQADKVLDSKEFLSWTTPDIEKQGLIFLSNWEYGFRNLTNSKRPILTPADAKGLKIRTPPEIPIQAAMEAMGAIVQTIAFNELPMALTQGVVDGEENPIAVIYANKFYESQKYLTMTGHTYNSMVHVMSKKIWDNLTKEQQKIIKEESVKAGLFMRKTLRDEEAQQVQELKNHGMQVVIPDKSKFKAVMNPAYDRLKEACGPENVTFFLNLVDKMK